MITLRKNGYRVEFEETSNKVIRRNYDKDGRLVIIATNYDTSIKECIKPYLTTGWTTENKKIIKEDEKIPEFVALLICGLAVCIVSEIVKQFPDFIKEIKENAKK